MERAACEKRGERGMMIQKIIITFLLSTVLSSCSLWPYRKDFDFPVELTEPRSLYDVSEGVEEGCYEREVLEAKKLEEQEKKLKKGRRYKRGK
jgi:hypothetical protein